MFIFVISVTKTGNNSLYLLEKISISDITTGEILP